MEKGLDLVVDSMLTVSHQAHTVVKKASCGLQARGCSDLSMQLSLVGSQLES